MTQEGCLGRATQAREGERRRKPRAGIEGENWAQVGSEEIPGSWPDGGPGHLALLILEGAPIPQAGAASTRVKG